ncbi:hypothetical protein V494_06643 [Pseudogymnoascus sp. VKM F-4513 (FW-928)]|nr:hypothetical protein V494_06643 [Pseudogymnoascus sp. VKM F-4513 (FW-928)]
MAVHLCGLPPSRPTPIFSAPKAPDLSTRHNRRSRTRIFVCLRWIFVAMDPSATGHHTPQTTQPGQGLPRDENIQDARPRESLFVTPDPDDDISVQGHAREPVIHSQPPAPQFNDHDQIRRIHFAQEAMKREILLKRKSGLTSIFESSRAKVHRPNPGIGPSFSEELPSIENMHHNMDNHDEEDHSWMDEDNGESYTDEREVLLASMATLEESRKNNNGELTHNQQLEYLQASHRPQTASRRLQKGESFSGPNTGTDDTHVNFRSNDHNAGMRSELAAAIVQKKSPRKRTINKTARDVYMSKQAAIAENSGNKRPAPNNSKSKKGRMRNELSGVDDSVEELLAGLIQTDTIKDRVDQGDIKEGPNIVTANKTKQLKELLSSVPRDYDANKAKNEKKALHEASKAFGHGKVKAKDGQWLLVGMKSSLYHHQLLGVDWMVRRELSKDCPHGGILADVMGLGKTVSTLATMVGNPPAKEDIAHERKATLIVVPAGLLSQWETEIKIHVDEKVFPKVMPYKASSRISINILSDCDIVLTSFTEVMNSWPFPNSREEQADAKKIGEDKWDQNHDSEKGDLHRVKWYRIVLDEAQAIKNHRSRTSVACHKLDSTNRWALSGTPIQNSLNELFPYFRFLRMNWTDSFAIFKRSFGDPDAIDSTMRLNVMLSIIMKRRTMASTILGRPLVQLPPIHPFLQVITLSGEERAIYRTLEERFRIMMNGHFREGTAEKNYRSYLTQLLRLRQAVSHPFLLEKCMEDLLTAEDLLALKHRLKRLKKDKRPVYEQIQQWVPEPVTSQPNQTSGNAAFGRSDFGSKIDIEGFLSESDHEKIYARYLCIICSDNRDDPVQTDCGHIFCRACLEGNIHAQAATSESDYTACPKCDKIFEHYEPYKGTDSKPSDYGAGSEHSRSSSGQPSKPTPRKRDPNYKPHIKDSNWLQMCIENPEKLLPSSKTIALKAQVLRWMNEAPDDKILIFTQFRMMTRVLGLLCDQEHWGHVYFTGDMNMKQRTHAVEQFHTNKNIRIMIAVLKCGGVGLNLACANRCITIDPWWNHSVEQQAYGRIFRIGQQKETHVTRLVVKNTVDMRILEMQKEKMRVIEGAMIRAGKPLSPLSIEEMASLFGELVKDEDGITQVVADYESEEESEGDYEDEEQDVEGAE